jgi:hypothetical protein
MCNNCRNKSSVYYEYDFEVEYRKFYYIKTFEKITERYEEY